MKTFTTIINEGLVNQPKQEFIIIKPGFIQYSTRILDELLVHGFVVRNRAFKKLSLKGAKSLYKTHSEESFYDDLCKYMSSDYSMGVTLINTKDEDLSAIKANIRLRYGVDDMRNAIHSSDSTPNMKRESKIYFKD